MNLDEAMYTFGTGENFHLQNYLGVHELEGEEGFIFRVWAPHAEQIQVIGDFTGWFDEPLDMTKNHIGVWEATSALPQEGQLYKFLVKRKGGQVVEKMDPFATYLEPRPGTGAVIRKKKTKKWKDGLWMGRRKRFGFQKRPVNIYEAHASSWKLKEDGQPYTFKELKEELIPYLVEMNYTHVEFMPLMAHPLGMSWGYQLMGYFAFEHTYLWWKEEFQDFVEACHQNNIGVLVDWVPGHYTQNDDALAYFDGTPTFEYQDHDRAHNYRWGALNFDLGKNQVQSFLISSALYWIENYHIDGIRVDAVSNMLYLDYDEGPWMPNKDGGNRNLEGYGFLQKLNREIKNRYPDVMMVAEESTAATPITQPIEEGGLGFDFKWNMGWMNDILKFYAEDPVYRQYDFNLMTFSFMYCNENYVLPFSHDEVVHGKKSMMHKMWGDRYNQFAGLRNLYAYQLCHPGKKLLFMGSEFGQFLEWKFDYQLEWGNLEDEMNQKMQAFTSHMNAFYKDHKSLWQIDDSYDGIEIIDADNRAESVLSFIRKDDKGDKGDFLVCVFNLAPVERQNFTIGLPVAGIYQEVLNTEMEEFGGVWKKGNPETRTQKAKWKDYENTLSFTLPALGASIWRVKRRLK